MDTNEEQNTNVQEQQAEETKAKEEQKKKSDKATEGKSSSESYAAILDKLDEIIGKKTDGVAKSIVNANTPEGEDSAAILEAWKARRDTKQKELESNYASAKSENEQLKAQIVQMRLEGAARNQASTMGVSPNALDYVIKLADFSKVMTEKGEIIEEKMAAALQEVLDKVPAFKSNTAANAGFRVGGDGGNTDSAKTDDDLARRVMGLGPKK